MNGTELKPGDRVRLRPSKRADIFDTILDGRTAVIAGIEADFEARVEKEFNAMIDSVTTESVREAN